MPSTYSTKIRRRRNPKAGDLTPPDHWVVTNAKQPDPRQAPSVRKSRSEARTYAEQVMADAPPVVVWEVRGDRFKAVWRSLEATAPRPIDEHGYARYPNLRRRNWK